jgi:hypothetical protein
MSRSATLGGLCLGLCLGLCPSVSVAAQSVYAFDFHVPDGWRRLSGDYPDPSALPADAINVSDGIPADYMREAMSGTYQFYAVDPKGDRPSTVGAIATGAEVRTTGRITPETIEQYISGLAASLPAGIRIKINEARLVKFNGVDVAMFSGSVPTAATQASSSGGWECPSCKRRVPARVPQCRCGATRP